MPFRPPNKDHLGALICILLGLGVLALGMTYGVGTLREMGAGFVPVVIGTLLVVVGAVIGLTATPRAVERFVDTHRDMDERAPEWRGWSCIVGGLATFVLLGTYGGLVPASFFSVFIAALGDRANTLKSASILAAVVTTGGVVVFHYVLNLQFPLFRWG